MNFASVRKDPMNTDVLTTKVANGIAVITLGSAKRIYFDAEVGNVLTDVLDRFAGDPGVRVVVVTGGAPDYFIRHFSIANITSPSRSNMVEAKGASHD